MPINSRFDGHKEDDDGNAPHYAHSHADRPWEPLADHLALVARGNESIDGAASFAASFGGRDWGMLLGLWHDLGKYSAEFQAYLRRQNGQEAQLETLPGKVDHATAGAQHAAARFPDTVGRILAYCITGHHGGLLDAVGEGTGRTSLNQRLKKRICDVSAAPHDLLEQPQPAKPLMQWQSAFDVSVFCRMLFSCLVDADFLATESYMRPDKAADRVRELPTPADLLPRLDAHLAKVASDADDTDVNRARAEVLRQCREKADSPAGLFSLTVPTGGGKTFSSLAFALKHAAKHDLRRVIYAIPFTSIIEQNVDEFRKALGADAEVVLEHHSNLDPDKETVWGKLASENWDAPLVVTTNVQLFESLFACSTSRCRKLHRIARSVIVLDECQTLPIELLRATLDMLDVLRRNYGCTIVLCTATQPAILHRDDFTIGLKDVREIIDDPPALFSALKRVEVERSAKLEDDELVARLAEHDRVLCIVNTRKHAAALFQGLRSDVGEDGVFHLSAGMCPAHRSDAFSKIRERLGAKKSCRVISTQLVEAGVDLDFPVVYRALAGLDSIAQAAGRCNREGRDEIGRVVVFETDRKPPSQVRSGAEHAHEVACSHKDLLGLDAIEQYFRLHYWSQSDRWDHKNIMKCFSRGRHGLHFQFRQAADAYRLIPEAQMSIIVPYDARVRQLIDRLRAMPDPPGRNFSRKLQRYVVGVYERDLRTLCENQVIAQYHDRFHVLQKQEAYDRELGLRFG